MPHLVRKLSDSKPKKITCGLIRKLTSEKDSKQLDIVHVTIEKETKEHFHKNLTEVYFVLKGSIEVELDDAVEQLSEGQMIMILPNTKHKAKKTSEAPAELLVVCSPPWQESDEILL